MTAENGGRLRVDKWLWQARFFKSRARAGEVCSSGRLRINSERCVKPAQSVKPGDVLTFPQARAVRVIRVEAIGMRRGPASEAATLYTDLEPPAQADAGADETADAADAPLPPSRAPGSGRPTKRERREIDGLRRRDP